MNDSNVWDDRFMALRVGMTTAAEVVRQKHGSRYAQCVLDYEAQWWAKIEARKAGCREMVETDIFLVRPLMAAADVGWPDGPFYRDATPEELEQSRRELREGNRLASEVAEKRGYGTHRAARGIEAGTATTGTGVVHESPVR